MKNNILLIFLSIPFFSSGQDKKLFDVLPLIDGKVNYNGTVFISNKSSVDLENKIIEWYAAINKHLASLSGKERMESMYDQSPAAGKTNENYFTIKWKQPLWSKYDGDNNLKVYVWYSILLTAFENGYHYEITGFTIIRYEKRTFLNPFPSFVYVTMEKVNTATTDEKARIICNEADEEVKKIISSLEQFMKS